jgi:ABC-type sugar transport system ATPase subunit/ribose/xylose/arabinose/galactoside ABC-type transport system permease subunit
MQPFVELTGIGKSFPGVVALRDVSLMLYPGRVHALVGENGAGKSTLLNILAGLLQPDRGEVRIAGRVAHLRDARDAWAAGIVTVHQEVDLFADLSVLENIALQQGLPTGRLGLIDWPRQRRRTADALAAVGEAVRADALAATLTPAERQLTEIAGALSRLASISPVQGTGSARVLVLDEPTSSLSAAEAETLFGHLRRFREQGTAVVYVSHRLEEVFRLADEITVLRDGARVWTGPAAETSREQLIRLMVGRDLKEAGGSSSLTSAEATPLTPGKATPLTPGPSPPEAEGEGGKKVPGPVRLECEGLTAADSSFHDVTLAVRGGEVLGLYGLVGAGRSEWAQAVFGLRGIAGGGVRIDGRAVRPASPGQMAARGVAYVPEDRLRQGLCLASSVRLNAVLTSLRRLAPFLWLGRGRETRLAQSIVSRLGVRLASLEQPVGALSGGNQQKVVLGRWLEGDPAVLLLDEPTRGVDVGAREEIYALVRRLRDEGRAVVLISSDLPEVLGQSDTVGVFRAGRLVAGYPAGVGAEEVAAAAFPPADAAGKAGPAARRPLAPLWFSVLRKSGLALFVAAFLLAMQAATGVFLEPDSLRGLATETALLGFCALGAMLVLVAGGLDISLGALMALSAGVAGRLWEQGWPLAVVLPVALGVGAAGGAVNAGLSLAGRVHPIVVTLGTLSVYRGLTLWWLGGDVQIPSAGRAWATDSLLGWPVVAWLGLAVFAAAWLVLGWTVPGRELYALGSNPAAARRVGVSRARVWLAAFSAQGALVGLAGLLSLAQSGALQPTSYDDRTLAAIAAAVVGGTAVTGGRGSVWGVALGCLFLVALEPACTFLGVRAQWQQGLVGAVLLAAVLLDALARGRFR